MWCVGSKNKLSKEISPIIQSYITKDAKGYSEYNMLDDFKCIWQKETKANFDSNRITGDKKNTRVEKLFVVNK